MKKSVFFLYENVYFSHMYHLVYTSHAVKPFTEEALLDLLKEARTFNKSNAITGMLLYLEGKFIQVLEGRKSIVQALYQRIIEDPRHQRVTLVVEGNSPTRIFKNWSMGFKRITYHDVDVLGFRDIDRFFAEPDKAKENHLLMVFLKIFYKENLVDYVEV